MYGKLDGPSSVKEQANVDVPKTFLLLFGQQDHVKLVAERPKSVAECQYSKDNNYLWYVPNNLVKISF